MYATPLYCFSAHALVQCTVVSFVLCFVSQRCTTAGSSSSRGVGHRRCCTWMNPKCGVFIAVYAEGHLPTPRLCLHNDVPVGVGRSLFLRRLPCAKHCPAWMSTLGPPLLRQLVTPFHDGDNSMQCTNLLRWEKSNAFLSFCFAHRNSSLSNVPPEIWRSSNVPSSPIACPLRQTLGWQSVKNNTQVLINVRNNHKLLARIKAFDRHCNMCVKSCKPCPCC